MFCHLTKLTESEMAGAGLLKRLKRLISLQLPTTYRATVTNIHVDYEIL